MSNFKIVLGFAFLAGLCGCSGNGSSSGPTCAAAQTLSVTGYSTGSTPQGDGLTEDSGTYPTDATFIYFSAGNQPSGNGERGNPQSVTGTPLLKGSDGSTLDAGTLQPIEVAETGGSENLFGYSASIAGLAPNVTYAISFASLTGVPSNCHYGAQQSGSFTTGT